MCFYMRPHLQRARRLIDEHGDNPASLVYAALELRLGIERVCYEMLKLRLDFLSASELQGWQPRKVIEALEELADPLITQSAILSVAAEDGNKTSSSWIRVAERKPNPAKQLGQWWYKLGSFLHVQAPKTSNQPLSSYPEASPLKVSLLAMIDELEPFSHGSDFHIASPLITFKCSCGFVVQRTASTLKHGKIVVCINPDCKKEWRVRINEQGEIGFEENLIELECQTCRQKHFVQRKIFRNLDLDTILNLNCNCGKCTRLMYGYDLTT